MRNAKIDPHVLYSVEKDRQYALLQKTKDRKMSDAMVQFKRKPYALEYAQAMKNDQEQKKV